MIQAEYDRRSLSLTVKGHAGSNVYGKDLVCAAVSALVLTLSANVGRLRDAGQISEAIVILEPGNAHIRCRAKQAYRAKVEEVFETVSMGFGMLERKFPRFVEFCELTIDNG